MFACSGAEKLEEICCVLFGWAMLSPHRIEGCGGLTGSKLERESHVPSKSHMPGTGFAAL